METRKPYFQAFQKAFEKSRTAKAIIARDGTFIAANEECCKILEYSELELLRKRFQDITDPDDINIDEAEAERVAEAKIESYEMIKGYITKTKHFVKVRLRVDAVRDEDDRFLCFLAQITPVLSNTLHKPENMSFGAAKVLVWLHKNMKWILWFLGGIAAFIGWIIKENQSS